MVLLDAAVDAVAFTGPDLELKMLSARFSPSSLGSAAMIGKKWNLRSGSSTSFSLGWTSGKAETEIAANNVADRIFSSR
jgi:hypothetical protein